MGVEGSENRLGCTGNEITHFLSSNRTRFAVNAVRTNSAAPAIKLLTCCQGNRTRAEVKVVRANPAVPAMKITHILSSKWGKSGSEGSENTLHCTCHEITHMLLSQSGSECSENRPSCTSHESTYFLLSQQDQSGSEGSENRPSSTSHEITHKLSSQGGQK